MSSPILRLNDDRADDARLDELTGMLAREVREALSVDVTRAPGTPAPDGAKGDAATVGALVVAAAQLAGGLAPLVQVVRDWLLRTPHGDRRVRVEIDGDVLELTNASGDHEDLAVRAFLERHGRRR